MAGGSGTPDFILDKHSEICIVRLKQYSEYVTRKDRWDELRSAR